MSFLTKLFGDSNERYLKQVAPINNLEQKFESPALFAKRAGLKERTAKLKQELKEGKTLDDILAEAFALVREASKRTLGQRHFDVQLMGGIALHQGKIAQMVTGEGKTLAATLPAYLNALSSKGVHIVTVNDYLARRDTVWMGQIYHALGLSVGCIVHEAAYLYDPLYRAESQILNRNRSLTLSVIASQLSKSQNHNLKLKTDERDKERDAFGAFKIVQSYLRPCSRKEAYDADITYGTNNEFGFDYLRDNMALSENQLVQRELNFAIVDEIDFILIDESRTPLIISAPDAKASEMYKKFSQIIPYLKKETDFEVDEERKVATLTEQGINKLEKLLKTKDIYGEGGLDYLYHLEQGLRAYVLFHKDTDYVVKNGQVIIVDEFTGRLMPGRRWSGGLHQAIEAKEGVEIQPESRTLATITFQNYFRLYKKLAGMTGTAITSAEEFDKVYGLDVICIPTNKPLIRTNLSDRVYKTEKGKFKAVLREIQQRHKERQPVLIGTRSIEKNEVLGKLLEKEGLSHQILNAKNHEKEGEIIAQAGKLGAITVATNMAGRGVDILLGGYPPSIANSGQLTPKTAPPTGQAVNPEGEPLAPYGAGNKKEGSGLYKEWEKEHNKAVSLGGLHVIGTERHEARRIDDQLRGRAGRQGDPGSNQFFLSLEDELLRIFGGERVKALMDRLNVPEDEPISASLITKAVESAQAKIEGLHFDARKNLLDYDEVMSKHRDVFYKKRKEILKSSLKQFREILLKIWEKEGLSEEEFLKKEKELGENFLNAAKLFTLRIYDSYWMSHLEDMDWLRDSVKLKSYGRIDPLVEYKTEGYHIFQEMMKEVDETLTKTILRFRSIHTGGEVKAEVAKIPPSNSDIRCPNNVKVGRNDPCPCGSLKKYKRCCWPKYG